MTSSSRHADGAGTEHDAYQINGSCVLLAALEPLTGQRMAQVDALRTQKEFTLFWHKFGTPYVMAAKIRLVLDNMIESSFRH